MWIWVVKFCILILLTVLNSLKGTEAKTCKFYEFRCETDGSCLYDAVVCDGTADCKDGSDEKYCLITESNVCAFDEFQCESDLSCINEILKCNGRADCLDQSDERDCPRTETNVCPSYEFRCDSDGSCLDEVLRCNGKADCLDESDERDCPRLCSEINCQQECLNTISGARCYCKDGFELDVDNRTCLDIDECTRPEACGDQNKCINTIGYYTCECYDGFYMVSTGDCVKFDVKDSELIFFNEGYSAYIMKRKGGKERVDLLPYIQTRISGLSFQPKTEVLYISELMFPSIYAVNLSSLKQWSLVKTNLSSPKDVEFDWMSNNLYWVDSDKGTIEVISVDTLKRIVLVYDLLKPVSLALSPYRGHMFVSEIGFESRVSMYGMDGKDRKILHSVQGLPMSIAIHPSETLLFWSDPRLEMISYINYTKESPPVIPMKFAKGVLSVALSESKIFFTADEITEQADSKKSSEKVHEIKLLENEKDAKVMKPISYSHGMKPSGKSECLIENGGCSYLCLTSPNGRTCACSTAMTLDKDSKTCLGTKCTGNYFRCSDDQCIAAGRKCDGNKDCNDGSDELNCIQ